MSGTHSFSHVSIAIIGGSGFYSLDNLTVLGHVFPTTPWGTPSDNITVCQTRSGTKVAFLPRHGNGHFLSPTEVPSRANIAALKHIGVRVIVAFSAVGSLREELAPTHFVLPNQIFDRTKGIRPFTFFDNGIVGHVPFADPFHSPLADLISSHASAIPTTTIHQDRTLVCMEGPAFSTRAESNFYRSINADVINMSVLPEAKLAREAEIAYQMICLVTDYDCWRPYEETVNVETVMATMQTNKDNAKKLCEAFLPDLEKAVLSSTYKGKDFFDGIKDVAKFAVMTVPEKVKPEAVNRIKYILPHYSYNA